VHVLEDAVCDRVGAEPEVMRHLLVPGIGKVCDRKLISEQGQLELETKAHVEVVSELVGGNPDQGSLRVIDPAIELVWGHHADLFRETLL
jgi:hypothetical protein